LKISVISPHRGHACFSLGLSLIRWARAGHRIRLVNCFTRSNDAPFSDADTVHANDRTSYVSAMREREDEVFLRRVPGSEKVDLRLKDAPIRLRCGVDAVYGRAVDVADPAIAKIRAALEKRGSPEPGEIFLLPLGVGHHVDCTTAREAVLPFVHGVAFDFYEDQPYGSHTGAEQELQGLEKEVALRTGVRLPPTICASDPAAGQSKRELVGIYASQMDAQTADAIARSAEKFGGERIWASQRLADLVQGGIAGWSGPPTG